MGWEQRNKRSQVLLLVLSVKVATNCRIHKLMHLMYSFIILKSLIVFYLCVFMLIWVYYKHFICLFFLSFAEIKVWSKNEIKLPCMCWINSFNLSKAEKRSATDSSLCISSILFLGLLLAKKMICSTSCWREEQQILDYTWAVHCFTASVST